MTEDDLLKIIIDLVPQFYQAHSGGGVFFDYQLGTKSYRINTFRGRTPDLGTWMSWIRHSLDTLKELDTGSVILTKEIIETMLVAKWLSIKGYSANWNALFDYCRLLENRTYENSTIGFTFVYNPADAGTLPLIDFKNQKFLDVLSSNNYTFFRVGKDWNFIDYDFVKVSEITPDRTVEYKLIPEFLYPYQCILKRGECGIVRTKRGDLIIFDSGSILASNRKGEWKIYEAQNLKNALVDISPSYRMGANIFEIVLDLSYRRHGALLVFGTKEKFKDVITNKKSFLDRNGSDLHQILTPRIQRISLNAHMSTEISKQLILELASVDGALMIDRQTGKIWGFGAMINHHSNVKGETGARSTAALSAFYHGMLPIKISSDGEITIYFSHYAYTGATKELIKLTFL